MLARPILPLRCNLFCFFITLSILFLSFPIAFAEVRITPDNAVAPTYKTSTALCLGTGVSTHINLGFSSNTYISYTGTNGQNYGFCTIGGGGGNAATKNYSTVAGGYRNSADNLYSTVGGGNVNTAGGPASTVGGGGWNQAVGPTSTVGGGSNNYAGGKDSTVGGGDLNQAKGEGSVVSGGSHNIAEGDFSWAGGKHMRLTSDADRTFVWGHSESKESIETPSAFLIFPAGTSGKVGIGTPNPNRNLTIRGTGGAYLNVKANDGTYEVLLGADSGGGIVSTMTNHDLQLRAGGNITRMIIKNDGNVGIGISNPNHPLKMGSGAHVTDGGVWTNASSREYKENIRDLSYVEAKSALSSLKPAKFNYKVDKDEDYLGFIAEDVPDLVATKDRKGLSPMDIVAVLTKVVQQQQETIEKQKIENAVLNTKLAEVVNRIEALEKW